MTPTKRSFASISVLELAAGALGLVLFAVTLTAAAQTPNTAAPAAPPTVIGADGKPLVAAERTKVLADPATKLYSRCTTGDEHEAPDPGDPTYKPNPKSQLMTEDAAKAKGFRPSAHKISCK